MRSRSSLFFSQRIVLSAALLAALVFALFAIWRYDGEWRDLLVFYFAPIGIPFIIFLFDRAEHRRVTLWLLDVPVVILAVLRSAYPIPLVSGHSLFLTYALFTTHSTMARLSAFIILIQVIILKTFVWHDTTLIGGVVAGAAAAWINYRWRRHSLISAARVDAGIDVSL
ncbi:MAG: hypothetical protein R3E39_08700 [Anaerolineae bacterium]